MGASEIAARLLEPIPEYPVYESLVLNRLVSQRPREIAKSDLKKGVPTMLYAIGLSLSHRRRVSFVKR